MAPPSNKQLKDGKIIPDVIPNAEFMATVTVDIHYKGGVDVKNGNEIDISGTGTVPRTVKLSSPPPEGYEYLLAMTDPDAPSRSKPTMREWAHWVVAGIPGDTLEKGSAPGTQTLLPYNGPNPPAQTGLHRYVFLLFTAPAGSSKSLQGVPRATGDSRIAQPRGKWDGTETAWNLGKLNNLECVGVTWFECQRK